MSCRAELIPIDERRYVVRWELGGVVKELHYDDSKCKGCGLCVKACPLEAIELGPVREVVEGKITAPKVLVNEAKCVVCSICSSACPYGALRYVVRGVTPPEPPRVKGSVKVDVDACKPCLICERVCPAKAIRVELEVPRKEDLVRYEGEAWARGRIVVKEGKCTFCGRCELLCDAIRIEWAEEGEVKAPDYRVAVGIWVDEEECDYCGLCAEVCPYDAIEVECYEHAPRTVESPVVKGRVEVVEEDCFYCGLCAGLCPANAIRVVKPFEGEIAVLDVKDCDPAGCKNCQLACPVSAFYVERSGRLRVDDRYCIYCGACVNACPADAIVVRRLDYRSTASTAPWSPRAFMELEKLVEGYRPPRVQARYAKQPKLAAPPPPSREVWPEPPGLEVVRERLRRVLERLRTPRGVVEVELKARGRG